MGKHGRYLAVVPGLASMLGLMMAASSPAAAQAATASPLVGPWTYGFNRCETLQSGYPSDEAAIQAGGNAYYAPGTGYYGKQACEWWVGTVYPWGTPENKSSPACAATKVYPKFTHGVESTNTHRVQYKRLTWHWNDPAKACDIESTDSLTIYRQRAVSCPEGWYYSASLLQCRRTAAIDPAKNCRGCAAGENGTNPINSATGYKTQREVVIDLPDLGRYELFYSSNKYLSAGSGTGWSNTYSRTVVESIHQSGKTTVWLTRQDGQRLPFNLIDGRYVPEADVTLRLYRNVDVAGEHVGWRVEAEDATVETYDVDGRLIMLQHPLRPDLHIEHARYGIASVRSDSGRSIDFVRNGYLIKRLVLPDGNEVAFEHAPTGGITAIVWKAGGTEISRRSFLYEDARFPEALTGIVDGDGQRTRSWSYDALGRATLSTHGDAQSGIGRVALSFNADGSTTAVGPLGGTRNLRFHVSHGVPRLASASADCTGCTNPRATTYDANGHPDVVTDFAGVTTDYDYDARGLIVRQVDAANDIDNRRTTRTDWHATFRVPTERRLFDASDAMVARTTWSYNARGQVLSVTQHDPVSGASRKTTTSYCEQSDIDTGICPLPGLVTQIDGPRTDVGDITTFTYYASDAASCATAPTTCPHRKGDLWKVTNALGHVTETLAYDGAGRVLSSREANGVITDYAYHPRGWLLARTVRGGDEASASDDAVTRIEYTPTGLVSKVVDADGAFTAYEYDQAQRLVAIVDGAGNRIAYTLDNAGNRVREDTLDTAGVLMRTLSRVYDQLGQLQTVADADANPTDFTYDAEGHVETVVDALGRVTDHDHDPLGRLRRTLQDVAGIGAETAFAYDAQDRLTRVTDPKGLATGYRYNAFGDLVALDSPDTDATAYTYDSAGNRTSATGANGTLTVYVYDALNRLTGIGYDDPALDVAYVYDTVPADCGADERFAVGRLSEMHDGSGSTRYCYDALGHAVRKAQTTGDLGFTTQAAYTPGGRLAWTVYPSGARIDYGRNALGQPTTVTVTPAAGTPQALLSQVTYYPFGPAAELTYGDGRSLKRSLNRNYQPGFIEDPAPGGLSLGYEFDAVGNLVKLRNADQAEPPLRTYGYDALNRLAAVGDGATGTPLQHYAYDATGNRLSATTEAVTTAYAYPADSHRLGQVGAVPRDYDAAGNTTAIGTQGFVYTAANRLGQALRDGAVVGEYRYNGRGEQVWRQALVGVDCQGRDSGTDRCRSARKAEKRGKPDRPGKPDGTGKPDTPGKPTGATLQDTTFVYNDAGQLLGQYDATGVALQEMIWLDDLPVGVLAGAGPETALHHIQPDHLGTPRAIIDPARQQAIWAWPLTGEAFGNTSPNEDPDGDGSAFAFDLRFPGQRYDAASGMNYNYFRDYDASAGRYVQSDPIGQNGGAATYLYSAGNSLTTIDAFGLMPSLNDGPVTGHRVLGWVSCSRGSLKPVVVERVVRRLYGDCAGPISDCIQVHEQSHIDDARRLFPSICAERFWEPSYWRVRHLANSGWGHTATEFGAHASQLTCLVSKLRQLGECDEKCRKTILRAMRDVSRNIRSVADGTYGGF